MSAGIIAYGPKQSPKNSFLVNSFKVFLFVALLSFYFRVSAKIKIIRAYKVLSLENASEMVPITLFEKWRERQPSDSLTRNENGTELTSCHFGFARVVCWKNECWMHKWIWMNEYEIILRDKAAFCKELARIYSVQNNPWISFGCYYTIIYDGVRGVRSSYQQGFNRAWFILGIAVIWSRY